MKCIVFALISLFVTGKAQTAQPQLIEVNEGDNATIRCQSHPTINLEEFTLDVKQNDGNSGGFTRVVYSRRHGKDHYSPQMEQYRNRVALNEKDLRVGAMTVVIHSLQRSDSGLYKCYIPRLRNASYFKIVVKNKQNRTAESDFTTRATVTEEMTDAGETGAAPKKPHHHGHGVVAIVVTIVVTIAILCLLVGVVFLVLVKKGVCMSRKGSEGDGFELETLNEQARR